MRVAKRSRLGLLGGALVVTGVAMLWYAVGAIGSGWDFASWTPLTRGAQIYQASCSGCHGGSTGGDIGDYPPKHNSNGHTWQHPDCELLAVIRTGQGPLVETTRRATPTPGALSMPAFRERLSDTEIEAVLAFIKTMWTDDQRRSQERATREQCT